VDRLREKGHHVYVIGEGHPIDRISDLSEPDPKIFDFFLEIDNGRGTDGKLRFQRQSSFKFPIPSAVVLIDSHGYPDLHKDVAGLYDHVFFAVYARRDLFVGHPSAHWHPNATDPEFFYPIETDPEFHVGFFGSKGGLHRANELKEICETFSYPYDIRQVGKAFRHKWPATCEAMNNCAILFNRGQKHDGPNQRVMESMACNRPLLNDLDPRDGMARLFEDGKHYVGYSSKDELEDKLIWLIANPEKAEEIAKAGYEEVLAKHTVSQRVDKVLEVINEAHS
jgi:hypothetical protein